MASTLPGTTNLSRFFNRRDFSNSVELVVNETKFVCSGVMLAQQSPVFEQLLTSGASFILLQHFFYPSSEIAVEECITLLYGGKALVTQQNIELITKFAAIYEIRFLWDMTFSWINENTDVSLIFKIHHIAMCPEVVVRKPDLLDFVLQFIEDNQEHVAEKMIEKVTVGEEITGPFITSIVKLSNGPQVLKFLALYANFSEDKSYFVLDLSEFIDYEKAYKENKNIFNELMVAIKTRAQDCEKLKQLLDIQLSVLKIE